MKEWLRRAIRTFIQTFIGYLSVNLVTAIAGITDKVEFKTALIGVIISAIAAGLAALMNLSSNEETKG